MSLLRRPSGCHRGQSRRRPCCRVRQTPRPGSFRGLSGSASAIHPEAISSPPGHRGCSDECVCRPHGHASPRVSTASRGLSNASDGPAGGGPASVTGFRHGPRAGLNADRMTLGYLGPPASDDHTAIAFVCRSSATRTEPEPAERWSVTGVCHRPAAGLYAARTSLGQQVASGSDPVVHAATALPCGSRATCGGETSSHPPAPIVTAACQPPPAGLNAERSTRPLRPEALQTATASPRGSNAKRGVAG